MSEKFDIDTLQKENVEAQLPRSIFVILENTGNTLPGNIGTWFDEFCLMNSLDFNNKIINLIGYHIIELAKNAYDYGESRDSFIEIKIREGSIEITVQDFGRGFEDPLDEINSSMGGGFGLRSTMRFSDDFFIETRGKKFCKETTKSQKKRLVYAAQSDVVLGSRIIFTKKIPEALRKKADI